MRTIKLALVLFFLSKNIISQTKKRVLFIGNSYTYANNLPQMVADIAQSKSDTVVYDSSTPGGYTFQMHCANSITWQKIRSQKWDVVVLQAQSQEPAFSPTQVMSQTYPYAKQLCDSIRSANACTEIMFYMTWGRKNGDMSNCSTYSPVCTYNGMQARLRESYTLFKDSFMTSMAPVGVAWKNFRNAYPLIDLYVPDESHPSIHGTYLTACVFYSSIFNKTSVGSAYNPSLTVTDISNIQNISSSTVLDSITVWNLGSALPKADFSFSINPGFNCQFTNLSINALSYQWSFGSFQKNPAYIFPGAGTYSIQLKVINGCSADSIQKQVMLNGVKENENQIVSKFSLNNKILQLHFANQENEKRINIYSTDGKAIYSMVTTDFSTTIDLRHYPDGVYFVQTQMLNETNIKKIILTGF